MSDCKSLNIDKLSIKHILSIMNENTTNLNFSHTNITIVILKQIGSHCPNLTNLYLHGCDIYSYEQLSEGLKYIADGCPNLKVIDLTSWVMKPSEFNYLVSKCKKLEVIRLIHCNSIDDSCIKSITDNCSNLKYLDVSCCLYITDKSLNFLSQKSKKLETIYLHGGPMGNINITDEGITMLSSGCVNIKNVMLAYLPNITVKSIKTLLDSCKMLTKQSIDYRKFNI